MKQSVLKDQRLLKDKRLLKNETVILDKWMLLDWNFKMWECSYLTERSTRFKRDVPKENFERKNFRKNWFIFSRKWVTISEYGQEIGFEIFNVFFAEKGFFIQQNQLTLLTKNKGVIFYCKIGQGK